MAGRVKSKLLQVEKLADLVCGPDAYRQVGTVVLTRAIELCRFWWN